MSVKADGHMPIHPFSQNKLVTKADLQAACVSLLDPLMARMTAAGTRVKIGATGTRYDEGARQLEGYTRPLWGLGALLAGGGEYPNASRWLDGLIAGTDPEHPEYWGDIDDLDQRMVELAPLGFALAVAPDAFWKRLTVPQQAKVQAWLLSVNAKEMPNTNWLWFRVFANLGLKNNGAEYSAAQIEKDMDQLDTFYIADGFSNDGPRSHCQIDYYSGSFAIQFLQLLYVKLAGDIDQARATEYRARAAAYAQAFVHYFDDRGRSIPFGRSLTYRWAQASFWGALAYADVELPAPLSWGVVKGLLLRHLRWWTQQENIFNSDGTLCIGYTYPNFFLSEDYNSPGSVYWCMIAFSPLAIPDDHPFWTADELAYPSDQIPAILPLKYPSHIMVNRGGHRFLLSSGQACHYPLRATHAKYGRLAYSSAFPYSVPAGSYTLEQYAAENSLALSDDDGETWRLRRQCSSFGIESHGGVSVLVSTWSPAPEMETKTMLIPPFEESPNWHIRIHKITTQRALRTAEGAFAIYGVQAQTGRPLLALRDSATEGYADGEQVCYVQSQAGLVGIKELQSQVPRRGQTITPDANTNLGETRTVIPTLLAPVAAGQSVWYITAVFAQPQETMPSGHAWEHALQQQPKLPGWVETWMARN